MKYLKYCIEEDKKIMTQYAKGYCSCERACKLISLNNNCQMTMKEFFEASWKWGFVRRETAEIRYQEYLRNQKEVNYGK